MKKKKKNSSASFCRRCARCCSYFCIEIDTPETRGDYDDLAWILAHRNVAIHVIGKTWQLMVHNRCRHLSKKEGCLIYDKRPRICRKHVPGSCEQDQKHRHDYDEVSHIFRTIEELLAYRDGEMRKKRKKAAKRRRRRA